MMEALGKWLLSVSAAALLVSVVQTLIPEGGMRRVASFTGGLLLLAVLLRPVLGADFSGLSAGLDRWTEQVEQRQWELESAQTDALAAGIAERAATYISDKGAALGLTVTAAVETRAGDNGIPVPYSAVIQGPWSEALSASIAADLGIPAERQTWKEQDNET